jgi:hypothetical protein
LGPLSFAVVRFSGAFELVFDGAPEQPCYSGCYDKRGYLDSCIHGSTLQSSRLTEFGGLGMSFNICRGTLGSLAMFRGRLLSAFQMVVQ